MKCIYLRTNTVNGKQYVGQTNDMKKRDYQWYNTNRFYAGTYITNARNKYGTENFKTEILKECDTQDELNQWEQYYIKELNTKYPNGYNLTDGGYGKSGCGKTVYQYTLDGELVKVWESATETVKYGYNLSKVSECCRGNRKTHQNFIWSFKEGSFKGKPKEKTVYQYSLDGVLVKIWKSAKECGRNGYSQGHVSSCCRGEYGCRTYKGFKWSYTKKEDIN